MSRNNRLLTASAAVLVSSIALSASAQEATDSADSELRVEAVGLAQLEIVLAMVGRHVDEAGARVGGDMIGGHERARASEEATERVHRVAGDGAG